LPRGLKLKSKLWRRKSSSKVGAPLLFYKPSLGFTYHKGFKRQIIVYTGRGRAYSTMIWHLKGLFIR